MRNIMLERMRHGSHAHRDITRCDALEKTFKCASTRVACDLAHELLELGERVHHRGIITIDGADVSVKVFTRGINEVTSLDEQWIDEAQAIFDALNR